MHCEKYDVYEGKEREDKVTHSKSALQKQAFLPMLLMTKSSKDSVGASFAKNEMIAKSSLPLIEGLFIKCLLKGSDILFYPIGQQR